MISVITLSLCILLFCVGDGEAPELGSQLSTTWSIGEPMPPQSVALVPSGSELTKVLSFDLDLHPSRTFEKHLYEPTFEVTLIAVFTESGRLVSVRPSSDWPERTREGPLMIGDDTLEKLSILYDHRRRLLEEVYLVVILFNCIIYVKYLRVPDKKTIWRPYPRAIDYDPELFKDCPGHFEKYVEEFFKRHPDLV